MTETPAYPGYATPAFIECTGRWLVYAYPADRTGSVEVGRVEDYGDTGWTACNARGLYVGLFPTQQAAGEALVKHAGYEVLR